MKTLLALVCLALPLAALAAEPAVEIRDTGNVYVDGTNRGAPADAIANNPSLAPAIQTALVAYVQAEKTRADAAIASATAAMEAEKQAAITTAQQAAAGAIAAKETEKQTAVATRDAAIAARDASLATANARVAALEQHVAALGVYIAGLRGTIAGLGGTSAAPPAGPQ